MKIIKVNGMTNHGDYANVEVVLEDGEVGDVYIGGDVERYFHHEKIKIFIKRPTKEEL